MQSIFNNLTLSLQELLAVVLPGAVATFFLAMSWHSGPNTLIEFLKADWIGGATFFAASYFIGYIVYWMSLFLDKTYDGIKRKALKIKDDDESTLFNTCEKETLSGGYRVFTPHVCETHKLVLEIIKYQDRDLNMDVQKYPNPLIDAHQYCLRRLMHEGKTYVMSEVNQYNATAKFFRSMVLVWLLGFVVWPTSRYLDKHEYPLWYSSIFLVLALLSFCVFLNRWRKAHHIAFKHIIIAEGISKAQKLSLHQQARQMLTERELGILDALEQGLSYHAIAQSYHISVHTIRSLIRSIYKKLQRDQDDKEDDRK